MRRLFVVLAVLAVLVLAPSASAWTWPLHGDVLRPYSLGPDAYAAGQHRGIDVAGDAGESVRAPASGVVSFAGVVPSSGRTVTIQLDGYAVSLTHLGEIGVEKGATVSEGDAVGIAGGSGDVEWPAPYVHLGVRISSAADGYVDPATLLPPRAAAPPPAPPAPVGAPAPAPAPVAGAAPAPGVVADVRGPVPGGEPSATGLPAPGAPTAVAPVRATGAAQAPRAPAPVPARPQAVSSTGAASSLGRGDHPTVARHAAQAPPKEAASRAAVAIDGAVTAGDRGLGVDVGRARRSRSPQSRVRSRRPRRLRQPPRLERRTAGRPIGSNTGCRDPRRPKRTDAVMRVSRRRAAWSRSPGSPRPGTGRP